MRLALQLAAILVLLTGAFFFTRYIEYGADEVMAPGETKVLNLTTNWQDYESLGATEQELKVPKYEKLELTFDVNWYHNREFENLAQKYDPIEEGTANPYWPYDPSPEANVDPHPTAIQAGKGISVDGLFLPPGETDWEKAIVQPGFYYQSYERQDYLKTSNQDWLYPEGKTVWKVRFAPKEIGQYQYQLRITDKTGRTTYIPQTPVFAVQNSTNKGFVQVSKTDSRYFETSDGSTINFVGMAEPKISTTYDIDQNFAKLNQMGVNLIRPWWQASSFRPVLFGISGQGGVPDWGFTLNSNNIGQGADQTMPDELFSIKLSKSSSSVRTSSPIKKNSKYQLSAWVKTAGITGTGNYGFSLYPYPPSTAGSQPAFRSEYVAGDTDWKKIIVDFTSDNVSNSIGINLNLSNVTAGEAYVTKLSLEEDLGSGEFGGELLSKPNLNVQNYISQWHAWYADFMVEEAQKNGIYMKVVAEEKQDMIMSRIGADGKATTANDNNVYASDTHANRIYQKYYWRYLTARYSYSTAIHSWEFCNEGDPYNGNHYNAILALGKYMNLNDANHHLTSGSTWHSFVAELWNKVETSYADLHRYVGDHAYGDKYVVWPGWDGRWFQPSSTPNLDPNFEFDRTVSHTGSNSLKIKVPKTTAADQWKYSGLFFQAGVIPGHQYELKWWAKADNIKQTGGACGPTAPAVAVYYSGTSTMWDGWPAWSTPAGGTCGRWKIPDGAYDWQEVKAPVFTIQDTPGKDTKMPIKYLGVDISYLASSATPEGTAWFDDITLTDVTTGETLNYNGGFEYLNWENIDVVANHQAYSKITNTFKLNKPTIRGETSIVSPRYELPYPYKGYSDGVFDLLLVDDTEGVWWRKWVWSNLDSGALTEIVWDNRDLLTDRMFKYGKSFQNFMADIKLSNGKYKDIGAISSDSQLRVLGQKEVIDGKSRKAHLWFDNAPYTWKAVVDNKFNYNDTKWIDTISYKKDYKASYGTPAKFYKSIQNTNKNHLPTDTAWWELAGDVPTFNPPLPSPISGNVTVPGMMPNVSFKLQWWNTGESEIKKQIIKTEVISSDKDGNLNIKVLDLVSDIALKIDAAEIVPVPEANLAKDFTYKSKIVINGTKSSSVAGVLVNGFEATIKNDSWEKEIELVSGQNNIKIVGKDKDGILSDPKEISIARKKSADANNDGRVDIKDFSMLLANWNKTVSGSNQMADLNEDTKVDLKDFSALMVNWGR